MATWPRRIPFDLHEELEARALNDWQAALRVWAKRHALKLKLMWWADLERKISDLHSMRFTPKPQDHWAAIREWLECHDVPAPDKLPGWPEQDSVHGY